MLCEQLKIIRKANGFTQMELSNAIGIERSTYASYETGRNRPDVDLLEKIAKVFNVTVDFIINIDSSKQYSLSDVRQQPEPKPQLLSELTDGEREIIAALRIQPEKIEEIKNILKQENSRN